MLDYKKIEAKWQDEWEKAKIFEVEPSDRKALMITAALPYVNSLQHIGHLRTYGTADMYARYMRMRGYNVLFPMAFHATGTPIISFAKRIRNKDPDLISDFKSFEISDSDIEKMVDPLFMVKYFSSEIMQGMKEAGLSIDWRRKFTTIDPAFSKMVEWQFYKLKEKNLLTQGSHPVGWCPNENNAVGQHDTKHDVQPEIGPMPVIKFKEPGTGIIFGCATYRPETIYGVTNLFVNEKDDYIIAEIKGEKYYMAKDAADILKYQLPINIVSNMKGADLLGKKAVNPITGEEVPVLPGFFVKGDVGTGVVMSVPSHAPFDYAALERLKERGYPLPKIEYKKLIEVEPSSRGISIGRSLTDVNSGDAKPEHPEIPALAYMEILHTNLHAIDDMLEFATKLIYREESHWGKMIVGTYKGMSEPEAREQIKQDLIKSNNAFEIHVLTNDAPVYCRCGARVVVKYVENQWFINYGNAEWKAEAKKMLDNIRIYPEGLRPAFYNAVDWINLRATERAEGLGTRFPFNPDHIIESLSDSTIYMSFYTISHIINSSGIAPDQLKPEFFDFMYDDIGTAESVANVTGIDPTTVKKCKESMDYWYSNTSRHSGPDLIPNHLIMYVFNHIALLKKSFQPKQIVVNGFVLYEGEKMSKSLGNIVPLRKAIGQYGVDPLRFVEIAGASLDTDTPFTAAGVDSVKVRNEYLYSIIEGMVKLDSGELRHIDYWLYSKLNTKIKSATAHMDKLEIKEAYTEIFYDSVNELKEYFEKGGKNRIVVQDFMESITLMLSPIMPHVAEEFWHELGKTTLVAKEKWPNADESMINESIEKLEEFIEGTISDARRAIGLTSKIDANKDKQIDKVVIIIADDWKTRAYNALVDTKSISKVLEMPELLQQKEQAAKFLQGFAKNMNGISKIPELKSDEVVAAFIEALPYIESKIGCRAMVEKESSSKSPRAQRAMPDKPSIDIIYK
ncbi:MAG: leucine--tRNA ligase [Candidatus Micrarchaeia archaeon]